MKVTLHGTNELADGEALDLNKMVYKTYQKGEEVSLGAHWYKKPYPAKKAAELLKIPAYYQLDSNEKATLIAFRVVDKPSSDCVKCRPDEAEDLERQRIIRQGLRIVD